MRHVRPLRKLYIYNSEGKFIFETSLQRWSLVTGRSEDYYRARVKDGKKVDNGFVSFDKKESL